MSVLCTLTDTAGLVGALDALPAGDVPLSYMVDGTAAYLLVNNALMLPVGKRAGKPQDFALPADAVRAWAHQPPPVEVRATHRPPDAPTLDRAAQVRTLLVFSAQQHNGVAQVRLTPDHALIYLRPGEPPRHIPVDTFDARGWFKLLSGSGGD